MLSSPLIGEEEGMREGCVAVLARFDILDGFGVDNFMSAYWIYLMSGIRLFPLFAPFCLGCLSINFNHSMPKSSWIYVAYKKTFYRRERWREGEEQVGNWRFILKIKRAEINEEKYFLQCSIKNKKKNEMKLKYFAIVKWKWQNVFPWPIFAIFAFPHTHNVTT